MNQRIVAFLYLLTRDDLPMGKVDRLLREASKTTPTGNVQYSNQYLRDWSMSRAELLCTDHPAPLGSYAWTPESSNDPPRSDTILKNEEDR